MASPAYRTVDEYIAAQPEAVQNTLEQVRRAIRDALPMAEEIISYKMPAYQLHGEIFIYFAAWKRHYSLYPAGERLLLAFKHQLAPYKVSKGTIQFPLADSVPCKLISEIVKFRARESAARDR